MGHRQVFGQWDNLERRRTPDALREWGYDVKIYSVPNPEAFLKAAAPPPSPNLAAPDGFPE